jgi:endonuclease G
MALEAVGDTREFTLQDRVDHILKDEKVKQQVLESLDALARTPGAAKRFSSDAASLRRGVEGFESVRVTPGLGELESIILRIGRPVLFVQKNTFDTSGLSTAEPLIADWRDALETARPTLEANIPSIGRVNVRNHPTFDWVGTCWLVADDIVVTNRHVAEVFATGTPGGGFTFRRNFRNRPMSASVDFRMEFGVDAINEFPLAEVLHIEPDPGPDMASFRLSRQGASSGATTGNPVRLSAQAPANDRRVAVIGYPAFDSRIPEPDTLRKIFGETFDIKRLAPGEIMRTDAAAVEHDASTLGGNSGSVVMDLATGEAVGLQFAGSFLQTNFAVPSSTVAARLAQLLP